jgi:hypothetical protein
MRIHPITISDAKSYLSILNRTSEEDRYCRFFHIVNYFDLNSVKSFVELAPDTLGFIAEDETKALGAVHAFGISQDVAEIAIIVANDARRQHVAYKLTSRMIQALHGHNCNSVRAYSLFGNNAFAKLAKSVDMVSIGQASEMMTWSLKIAA